MAKRQWFKMEKKKDDEKSAEIVIYDVIGASFWGEDTVSAKGFNDELKALGDVKNILLRVNSPGGDVFDGVAIYNMLANHPATVTARIDGIAASAASLIVMAADKIEMPQNAFMLVHEASGGAWGKAEDMLSVAADLERINTSMIATYAKRTGQSAEDVAALAKEDRLMTAEEAVELGYADETSEPVKMAAVWSVEKLPVAVREKVAAVMKIDKRPAAPAASGGSNVVNIDDVRGTARKEAIDYAQEIFSLCSLARKPNMASEFIKKNKSVADVRKELQAARAKEDDEEVAGQHATPGTTPAEATQAKAGWSKATAAVNKRHGMA